MGTPGPFAMKWNACGISLLCPAGGWDAGQALGMVVLGGAVVAKDVRYLGQDEIGATMITKRFTKGDAESVAEYSACEAYRYALTRVWDAAGDKVAFVMLNPSTATEVQNDPTVERCERRARALGFGAFRVVNIFAYRATDPKVMRVQPDPVGPGNDAAILAAAQWADRVVCAWGSHGAHMDRGVAVEAVLRAAGLPLFQLGLTKAGQPKHPLYISYDRQPEIWE